MQVYNILASKGAHVVTVRPEQPVREAIALLAQHNIGALVAIDPDGSPVGIISEREVVRRAAQDENVFSLPVRDVMVVDMIVGGPEEDLMPVANTMTQRRIRHLPIMEDGKLIGIISIGDVLKAQRDQYQGEGETLAIQILAEQFGEATV